MSPLPPLLSNLTVYVFAICVILAYRVASPSISVMRDPERSDVAYQPSNS